MKRGNIGACPVESVLSVFRSSTLAHQLFRDYTVVVLLYCLLVFWLTVCGLLSPLHAPYWGRNCSVCNALLCSSQKVTRGKLRWSVSGMARIVSLFGGGCTGSSWLIVNNVLQILQVKEATHSQISILPFLVGCVCSML